MISWAVSAQAVSRFEQLQEQIPFFCGCSATGAQEGLGCWRSERHDLCVCVYVPRPPKPPDRGAVDEQNLKGTVILSSPFAQHFRTILPSDPTGNGSPSRTSIVDYIWHCISGLTWDLYGDFSPASKRLGLTSPTDSGAVARVHAHRRPNWASDLSFSGPWRCYICQALGCSQKKPSLALGILFYLLET